MFFIRISQKQIAGRLEQSNSYSLGAEGTVAETLELAAGWLALASGPCMAALGSFSVRTRDGEGAQVRGAADMTHHSQVAEGQHTGPGATALTVFSRILHRSVPSGVLSEDQLCLTFCDVAP